MRVHRVSPDELASLPSNARAMAAADAFRRCLGFPVAHVGVAQRHARLLVAEQARDDRQRDALQNSVAGERMTQIMQAHVFDPALPCALSTRAAGYMIAVV